MRQTPQQVVDAAAAELCGQELEVYLELLDLAAEVHPWASQDGGPSALDLARFEAQFRPFVDRNRLHKGDVGWDRYDWRMHFRRRVQQS